MQFTEVSELNSNIDYIRLGVRTVTVEDSPKLSGEQLRLGRKNNGYVSPFFQDADPTVTKLLNHSPPVETFLPARAEKDVYAQQMNQRRMQQILLLQRQAKQEQQTKKVTHAQKVQQEKVSKAPPKPTKPNVNGKVSPQLPKFSRVPVKPEAPIPKGKGMLSKLMKSVEEAGGAGATGPLISLVIYFPDRTRLDVKVSEEATVGETIKVALKQYKSKVKKDAQPMHQAQLYELRLHDENGMPDEDFPALESNGQIANFWDDDEEAEFCLCEKVGMSAIPSSEDEDELPRNHTRQVTSSSVASDHLRRLENATAAEGFTVIKVILPGNNKRHDAKQYTIVQIPRGFKAYELLAKIQSKQRLPLFKDEYLFRISEADRQRLGLLTGVLAMDADVFDLSVKTLELFRRKYADAPEYLEAIERARQAQAAGLRAQMGVQTGVGVNDAVMESDNVEVEEELQTNKSRRKAQTVTLERREDPENFLFNELTSAVYEEWEVIKTNKWGKRQKRVMGIDHEKIYNRHRVQAGRGKLSNLAVKRAERNIADVLEIKQVENNPSAFTILYREGKFVESDRILLEYEAEEGPAAAALIIAKIKHNLARLAPP